MYIHKYFSEFQIFLKNKVFQRNTKKKKETCSKFKIFLQRKCIYIHIHKDIFLHIHIFVYVYTLFNLFTVFKARLEKGLHTVLFHPAASSDHKTPKV